MKRLLIKNFLYFLKKLVTKFKKYNIIYYE